jgi:hypothetical protein
MAFNPAPTINLPRPDYSGMNTLFAGIRDAFSTAADTVNYINEKSSLNKKMTQEYLNKLDLQSLNDSARMKMKQSKDALNDYMTEKVMNNKGVWRGKVTDDNMMDFQKEYANVAEYMYQLRNSQEKFQADIEKIEANPNTYILNKEAADQYQQTGIYNGNAIDYAPISMFEYAEKEIGKPTQMSGKRHNKRGEEIQFVQKGYTQEQLGQLHGLAMYGEREIDKQARAGNKTAFQSEPEQVKKQLLGSAILQKNPTLSDKELEKQVNDIYSIVEKGGKLQPDIEFKVLSQYHRMRLEDLNQEFSKNLGYDPLRAKRMRDLSDDDGRTTPITYGDITTIKGEKTKGYVINESIKGIPSNILNPALDDNLGGAEYVDFNVQQITDDGIVEGVTVKEGGPEEVGVDFYDNATPSIRQRIQTEVQDVPAKYIYKGEEYSRQELNSMLDGEVPSMGPNQTVHIKKNWRGNIKVDKTSPITEHDRTQYLYNAPKESIPARVHISEIYTYLEKADPKLAKILKDRFGDMVHQKPPETIEEEKEKTKPYTPVLEETLPGTGLNPYGA